MTSNRKIAVIKKKALDLFVNKQITRKHCRLILEADYKDDVYIKNLMTLTEDLLRVKGYYRDVNRVRICDQLIDEWLKQ